MAISTLEKILDFLPSMPIREKYGADKDVVLITVRLSGGFDYSSVMQQANEIVGINPEYAKHRESPIFGFWATKKNALDIYRKYIEEITKGNGDINKAFDESVTNRPAGESVSDYFQQKVHEIDLRKRVALDGVYYNGYKGSISINIPENSIEIVGGAEDKEAPDPEWIEKLNFGIEWDVRYTALKRKYSRGITPLPKEPVEIAELAQK